MLIEGSAEYGKARSTSTARQGARSLDCANLHASRNAHREHCYNARCRVHAGYAPAHGNFRREWSLMYDKDFAVTSTFESTFEDHQECPALKVHWNDHEGQCDLHDEWFVIDNHELWFNTAQ